MTDLAQPVEKRSGASESDESVTTLDLLINRLDGKFPQAKKHRWNRGAVIYHQNQTAGDVHFIHQGMVKLINHMQSGRSRIVRLMGENDVLGVESLLVNQYQHTAVALFNTVTYSVSTFELRQKAEQDREVINAVVEALYTAQRKADQWITDFSTGTAKVRVARLLQYLTSIQTGLPGIEDHKLNLLSVQDMADILGVTIESASRIVAAFKREKLLNKVKARSSKGDAAVYQLDEAGLTHLLN